MQEEESSQQQTAALGFNSDMKLNNMIGFKSDMELNQLMSATTANPNFAKRTSFKLGSTLKKDPGFVSRNTSMEGDEYGKILNNEIKAKVSNDDSEVSEEVSLEESKVTNETPLVRETPPLQPSGSNF